MDGRQRPPGRRVTALWRERPVRAVVLVVVVIASVVTAGFTAAGVDPGEANPAMDAQGPSAQIAGITSCTVIDEPGRYALTADIRESGADSCLDVRTSDVVIDGNGYVVDGVGRDESAGVSVAGTQETAETLENVTVRDLRLTDWGTGVQAGVTMMDGPAVTLQNVHVRDSTAGIRLGEADGSILDEVRVAASGDGIYVGESTVTMQSVVVTDNDGYGVFFGQGSTGSSLTDALVSDNAGNGIVFDGPATDLPVRNVTVSDNNGSGILLRSDVSNATVRNAVVANNENDGIRVLGGSGTFSNVTTHGNYLFAYNATQKRGESPVLVDGLHYRGHDISFETQRIGVRWPTNFPSRPDGVELAGHPILIEGLEGDGSVQLSMEYGRFGNVESENDVGVWYHAEGGEGWNELGGVTVDLERNRATTTAARNGIYVPLASVSDGGGTDSGPSASLFEIRSTDEDSEFAYRFEVDGTVEKTKLGPGQIAADVSDVVVREDGTVTVDGSTGEARGDAYLVWGEITDFEIVSPPADYRLFLDGDDVTGERPPGSGERPADPGRTFEVRSTNENTEFSYRIVVDGSVEKTQLGDGGIAADVSDVISRQNGNVVVDGSTGDGAGDAYRVRGEVVSFEVTTGPRDVELFFDGADVTDRFLDGETQSPARTFEIRTTDAEGSIAYRFEVDGSAEKAQLGDDGIAADASDVISETDGGTVTVDGSTGDGAGDAYRIRGEITSFERVSGQAGVRLFLDGEDVTDWFLADAGNELPGDPSIEYLNCSAVRASGDYAEVRLSIILNANDGVDTGSVETSRAFFLNMTDGTGVYDADGDWGSINGSVVNSARLVDEDGDEVTSAPVPEGCVESVKPRFELGVADVSPAGDGTLKVTFEYVNDHESRLPFNGQSLRGNAAPGAEDELPDELAPGRNSFTVQWTPESEDERLTWVLDSTRWTGLGDTVEVSTGPASAYDVTITQAQVSAVTNETATETNSPTETESPTPTVSLTSTDTATETSTPNEQPTPTEVPTDSPTPEPTEELTDESSGATQDDSEGEETTEEDDTEATDEADGSTEADGTDEENAMETETVAEDSSDEETTEENEEAATETSEPTTDAEE